MNEGEVVVADAELELTHSLHERRRFNVTDGPSELLCGQISKRFEKRGIDLDDANIRLISCIVHRNLSHALDPVLDRVCDMGNNLKQHSDWGEGRGAQGKLTCTVFPKYSPLR
jgi:hypothetical protein